MSIAIPQVPFRHSARSVKRPHLHMDLFNHEGQRIVRLRSAAGHIGHVRYGDLFTALTRLFRRGPTARPSARRPAARRGPNH